ncbi:efflux RND transporter permease subunit, partial [Pseudomonas viridiflava]|uniref:efflux RND transporter permease subunit n=1 Tax=Pseudomonas viridiflava TaxID=33069 RepID=UPI0013E06545
IYPADGSPPVPLAAVARIVASSEPSTLMRRNQERAITVVGHNPSLTATPIVEQLAPQVAALPLPPGYRIELGGEIEDSADANQALRQYPPHA